MPEQPPTPALVDAARRAGLIDNDLLKLAPPGAEPAQAISTLKQRFPRAFAPVAKKVTEMTDAEYREALAQRPWRGTPADQRAAERARNEADRARRITAGLAKAGLRPTSPAKG
jgi:hypothetical protein